MSFRSSMLVVLWAIVPAASISAAEDDHVVDGPIEVAVTPVQNRPPLRIARLPQVQATKALAERNQQLLLFLERIHAECDLTEMQMQKVLLAGNRDLRRLPRTPFGIFLDQPSPLFGTDFITADSLVYKVLMTQLTPEQKRKFEALRDREMKAKVLKSLK